MDVALVTCSALPGLHRDDRHLLQALRERDLAVEPAVWEDPHEAWAAVRLCVIRSTWDYAYRRGQFLDWAEGVARVTRLLNPLPLIRWNTHKGYLCDLAARGVPTVPTLVLEAGSRVSLERIVTTRGWGDVVIKAAVAQSGRYAMRVSRAALGAGQAHLDRLLPAEDMLVQPYLPAVMESGEASLVFIDGVFTHAVRKRSGGAEFRVHDDYGGTVAPVEPTEAELATAHRALGAVATPTLYARVDLVADEEGNAVVMELELVEPELFFRHSQVAVVRLATAIERELGRGDR